jgi:predicted ribosomally synthesized peptide with SipW-like signal peptide
MRRERRRASRRLALHRLRAVLAGGLVLGIGSAVTLAAWNDSEHGTATFTAGTFGIVGAADGTTFAEHPAASSPALLTFQVTPTALAPGTTTYALFSVRTRNPSIAGTVALTAGAGNGAGLGQHLTYGVRTIAGTACDAGSFASGTVLVPSGSPLTAGAATAQPLRRDGQDQINYCFAVSLPATATDAAQGQTLTARWEFPATSS